MFNFYALPCRWVLDEAEFACNNNLAVVFVVSHPFLPDVIWNMNTTSFFLIRCINLPCMIVFTFRHVFLKEHIVVVCMISSCKANYVPALS